MAIKHPTVKAPGNTLAAVADWNATHTIDADTINDTHIDWGIGANQVSADDIPDGAVNAIPTLVQETNWEAAFAHTTADGSSHTFINQSVTTAASPTFQAVTIIDATITKFAANAIAIGDMAIGGSGRIWATAGINDNLIINPLGSGNLYLKHDDGTGNVFFSNGASVIMATMDSGGDLFLPNMDAGDGDVVVWDTDGELTVYSSGPRELKKNIREVGDTSWIYDLHPVKFDDINNKFTDRLGLISDEVELINPSAVRYKKEKYEEEIIDGEERGKITKLRTTTKPWTINYLSVQIAMLKEIQKLKEEINELRKEIETN